MPVPRCKLQDSNGCLPEWLDLLQTSAREVFALMLGAELRSADANSVKSDNMATAFIGLGGDLCGVVSVITTLEGARLMASAMLGLPPEETGDSTWDALGEICNMVAGNFKGKLAGIYDHCVLSLPTVINGADYRMHVLNDGISTEARLSYRGHLVRMVLEIQQQ
jgi:chemotaxis protein CheX